MRSGWWFEDAVAGQTIVHPVARTVGADEHVWLAWMTVNASDLHGNADRAAFGPFGRPVVLGALTVAIVVGLAAPGGPVPPPTVTGRSGWRSIRLGRPVFAGDTLRAVSEVHARRPDGAVATWSGPSGGSRSGTRSSSSSRRHAMWRTGCALDGQLGQRIVDTARHSR